jgi:Carboxypeptidase regulatory-like domain
MIRKLKVIALTLLIGVLALPSPLSSQLESGQISGSVSDPSGALVPGATITVRNLGTNATRVEHSSAQGTYVIPGLPPASYEVKVDSAGYQPFTSRAEVSVGGRVTVDAKLSVTAQTTIEVAGEGGTQVNTQNQEVSQTISSQQVSSLPSLTRNPYDFVTISGNISSGDKVAQSGATSITGDQNDTTRGVGFSLNGQRSTGTEILLDGVANDDTYITGPAITVPLDSIGEYRVITSNFGAEYGRASGGVVNVVTKAGSNRFHGGAWEFNRLAAYTANTVQNAQSGIPKGQYTRNQFGYDIGGPIVKDKLFFFQSTEWVRVRSAASQISLVPTTEFIAASDPSTQAYFAAFAQNSPKYTSVLTKDQVGVNPIAGGRYAALPGSTPVFGLTPFSAPTNAGGGNPQNTYYPIARVDYNLSGRTQMFARLAYYAEVDQNGGQFNSPYSQYNVGFTNKDLATLYSLTHQFSPRFISNTKLSFTRNAPTFTYDTALQNTPSLFLYNNANINGNLVQLPGFYSQFEGVGGLPSGGPQNTAEISEDVDVSKGKHSIRFGTQLFYIQNNVSFGAYAQAVEGLGTSPATGLENFLAGNLALFSGAVNPKGALPCVNNYVTGSLVVTPQCQITLPATPPSFARSERFKEWALYGNDSFKVSPRFTVNYGLRYDYFGVQHNDNQNLDSNFYYGQGSTLQQQIRTGQVFTVPNSPIHQLWHQQRGTFSPRVGFAYDIKGDGKTSLRGGYGISYERNFGNVTFNVIQNPPNYAVVQIQNGTKVQTSNSGPLAGSSGAVPLPPTSLRNIAQNIRTAQTQFYSMSVERELGPNIVASVSYVGSRGIHLYDIKNYNELGAGNVYLGDPIQDGAGNFVYSRLNNQYSSINNRGSGGDSYYNGVNIGLQTSSIQRTGLAITANYTYAHSIDDNSSTFSESNSSSNGVGNLGYLNPFDPALDRGPSDFDVRHRFVLAPIYQTPFFHNSKGWKGTLLGGYQLAGIYTVRTGTPFTYSDSNNSLNAPSAAGIPRYLPGAPLTNRSFTHSIGAAAGANTYNLAALPAALPFGNPALGPGPNGAGLDVAPGVSDFGPYPAGMTGRNAFVGPGAWNIDLAVSKTFPIREGVALEFRAEGFDIFNHHNFYVLESNNDIANPGYGAPVPVIGKKGGVNGGANDERRFGQFALKVNF